MKKLMMLVELLCEELARKKLIKPSKWYQVVFDVSKRKRGFWIDAFRVQKVSNLKKNKRRLR